MSKAFLRESDESQAAEIPAPISLLPPGARNYLTSAGAARLREELRNLRTQRSALVTAAARDPEAKARLGAVDHRIRYLQQSLFSAEVIPLQSGPADTVRFGTTVVVRNRDGSVARYCLVGVDETDPSRGAISWVSPLAQALMNARKGHKVTVATPNGENVLTILDIFQGLCGE